MNARDTHHLLATLSIALSATFAALPSAGAQGAKPKEKTVPVTIDNFTRANTDHYFGKRLEQGALGRFAHDREPTAVDRQTVVRMNRDTPYSDAVFDLTTPVTIVKPDIGGRDQSIRVINQDHYLQRVIYEPGTYTFTQAKMGTRDIQMNARTFVDPSDPKDIAALHKAQDGIQVSQASRGRFEVPNRDPKQLDGLRKAILSMSPYVPDSNSMFGNKDEVREVRHRIGTAGGFGGNRQHNAVYLNVTPHATTARHRTPCA
jgi:hypothetical protein